MVGRRLTFWDDATIKLIKQNFVAAAVPTWVVGAKGPEGEFLRAAGLDKRWVTSSGYMSCLSASGKPLGDGPSTAVLEKFAKLPESERKPGALQFPPLAESDRTIPSPPQGGMVLRVHARFLSLDNGKLRYARDEDFPLMRLRSESSGQWLQPNTEYMWLTAQETKSLLPVKLVKGYSAAVDSRIAERMARFHLTPQRAMISEGGVIGRENVRSAKLSLVVEDVSVQKIRLRLTGFIHWGTTFDKDKATTPNGQLLQGFQTPLDGILEYDRTKGVFTRFDIVAIGEVWGRWGDANGKSLFVERPGATPFGFAFELAGNSPTERIPPGGNPRYLSRDYGYFSQSP
jgi:hypothetical protein